MSLLAQNFWGQLSGRWVGWNDRGRQGTALATLPRFHAHRLSLSKSRLLTRAAKGFLNKPLTKAPESSPGTQSFDYIPLVSAPDPRPQPLTLPEGPSWEPPAHPSPFPKGRRLRPSPPSRQQGKSQGA